ncbi:hypothetical protein OAA34_00695 [bacterium]|nr:hypothetical protein [bacterium]
MGLGFNDGFKPIDHVINLNWLADIQGLREECLSSLTNVVKQKLYSHYGEDEYKVVTPFGKHGIYPILDSHCKQLETLFDSTVGHSYIVQEPNTYYQHHCDAVATAFFQHSIFEKINLKDYFYSEKYNTSIEKQVDFFDKLCSYVYEAADFREDMFINIKDRLEEFKQDFGVVNDNDLSDDEIEYWRTISPRCSINVQLLEGDSAPVNYLVDGKSIDYYYDTALLNVDAKHGIKNIDKRRLIARFVIYDKTFTEVSNILSKQDFKIY